MFISSSSRSGAREAAEGRMRLLMERSLELRLSCETPVQLVSVWSVLKLLER